jgi:hypothetical protein
LLIAFHNIRRKRIDMHWAAFLAFANSNENSQIDPSPNGSAEVSRVEFQFSSYLGRGSRAVTEIVGSKLLFTALVGGDKFPQNVLRERLTGNRR